MDSIRPEFFSEPRLQKLFSILKDYVLQYQNVPSVEQAIEYARLSPKADTIEEETIRMLWESAGRVQDYQEQWLEDTVKSWAYWKNTVGMVTRAAGYIKTVEVDVNVDNAIELAEKVRKIINTGLEFSIDEVAEGYDFFDPEAHTVEDLETTTTGYPFIDDCLDGGFSLKTLIVFAGQPKVGKSQWLANLCANSIVYGFDSAYISLEMAPQKINQRIGSNLYNIPIDDYKKVSLDRNFMRTKINDFYTGQITRTMKTPGRLIVQDFPTSSATVDDIELFLLKKESDLSVKLGQPFKFKRIYIDYINIMRDKKHPNSENMYLKVKSICEDVRAMAQRNNWCVISCTQINRQGFDLSDLNMSNISESAGLAATVDGLFGIIQSVMMKASNVYYLKSLALRDSKYMLYRKRFNFDGRFLRITEDPNEQALADTQSLPEEFSMSMPKYVKSQSAGNGYQGQTQPQKQQKIDPVPSPMVANAAPILSTTQQQQSIKSLFDV